MNKSISNRVCVIVGVAMCACVSSVQGSIAVPEGDKWELNRQSGLYPGKPSEDASPRVGKSAGTVRRNMALRRAAYHSSSYDYNLTAQLVTDGIVSTAAPVWIRAYADNAELPRREREAFIDGMPSTALKSSKTSVALGIDFENYVPDADEVRLSGRVWLKKDGNGTQRFTVTASRDGEHWQEIAVPERRFAAVDAKRGGQTSVDARCPLDASAGYRYFRFTLTAEDATYWEMANVAFMKQGEPLGIMPSEHFCSTWRSASAKEEWVYVDLGCKCSFDNIKLNWINRAKRATVQTSDDAVTWRNVADVPFSESNVDNVSVSGEGRYVRLLCHESQNGKPYELSEFGVYGYGGMEVFPQTSWRVQRASLVDADGEKISTAAFDAGEWLPATVPGTVLTSYIKAGAVPDPNFSDNQLQVSESFFNSDFWYRGVLSMDNPDRRTHLCFDGINWKAEIYVNGKYVGRIDGAFKHAKFDVTGIVGKGDNAIAVRIIRNAHPGRVTEQSASTADGNGGLLGADNATFHASIGWDWIPTVRGRNIGIWNDVYFVQSGNVTIEEPYVSTVLPNLPDTTVAEVTAQMTVRNHANKAVKGVLRGTFGDVPFEQTVSLAAGEARSITFSPANSPRLRLVKPRLWWPNGYGEPYLYDLSLTFEENGEVSDEVRMKTGIRQVTWSVDPVAKTDDAQGKAKDSVKDCLTLYVNGRRFVGFGGNWGFAEHNLNYRAREYDAAVRYHRDMNFTMIRNWVGQIGDEEFYEACDRYGIMVWQDFWLANPADGPVPYYNDLFIDNATDWVKRIRNHPSIAIYVGRNEGNPPAVLDNALSRIVKEYHPGIHYISHSAAGVVSGGGPYRALPEKDYFGLSGSDRFHSERGMPNVMNYESIALTMKEDEMWPLNTSEHPNAAYGLHDYCLDSAMRCASFNNMISKAFGTPENVRQFAEWAQWINYNGYRAIFESRSKERRGILLWMSHPAWPSFVWQTYDYFLDPTAAYFACKKACEPLHVQWNASTNGVEVVNYRDVAHKSLKVTAELINQDGKRKWSHTASLNIGEDETAMCFTVADDQKTKDKLTDTYFIRLRLTDAKGKVLSENIYWQGKEAGNYKSLLTLPKADVSISSVRKQKGDEWVISSTLTNASDTPALMVRLMAQSHLTAQRITPALYSDNYLFLMPGESKVITTTVKIADCHGEEPVIVVK